MNIFFLSAKLDECAKYHCDKHVVKMILEYAQLLSTAHRIIDGKKTLATNPITGKEKTFYLLPDETIEYVNTTGFKDNSDGSFQINVVAKGTIKNPKCYYATHVNHPSAVWVRANGYHYNYLYKLFVALLDEYTYRYKKIHSTSRLKEFLANPPKNILYTMWYGPPQAMPDQYKVSVVNYYDIDAAVQAYRNYYNGDKSKFAKWTNRERPEWFIGRDV